MNTFFFTEDSKQDELISPKSVEKFTTNNYKFNLNDISIMSTSKSNLIIYFKI